MMRIFWKEKVEIREVGLKTRKLSRNPQIPDKILIDPILKKVISTMISTYFHLQDYSVETQWKPPAPVAQSEGPEKDNQLQSSSSQSSKQTGCFSPNLHRQKKRTGGFVDQPDR